MKPVISQNRSRSQRGNVFVESALIFTGFFCMLIAIFDFGQFLFIHQALVERARYAARWGAIQNSNGALDLTQVQNVVRYYSAVAPTDGSTAYFGLDSTMVQVSTSGSGTDDYRLYVSITNYPYKMITPYLAGQYMGPNITVSSPLGSN